MFQNIKRTLSFKVDKSRTRIVLSNGFVSGLKSIQAVHH